MVFTREDNFWRFPKIVIFFCTMECYKENPTMKIYIILDWFGEKTKEIIWRISQTIQVFEGIDILKLQICYKAYVIETTIERIHIFSPLNQY